MLIFHLDREYFFYQRNDGHPLQRTTFKQILVLAPKEAPPLPSTAGNPFQLVRCMSHARLTSFKYFGLFQKHEDEDSMAPDVKSSSWQKAASPARNSSLTGSSRRRLSEAFDKEKKPKGAASKTSSPSGPLREMRRQFSVGRFKIPNVRTSPTRRVLRSGADKITRTLQQLCISVDNFSQVRVKNHDK
jgi:hypothetical protein